MNYFDNKIDQFATYLQKRNNLDHIQFLQVRLGMQIIVGNFFKIVATYGISLLFGVFLYTLTTHLCYMLVRYNAHGAHAKSSLLCYIQSILTFVFVPYLLIYLDLSLTYMFVLSIIGLFFIFKYAPAETKKQPIPIKLIKRKKIKSIIMYILIMVLSIIINPIYAQFTLLGIIVESFTLLPIFFPKEELS
ncbi:accessory gene regulator B family protein [Staphylococcus sp. SS87]|nr:accessory gene regulator B family protein [Staphylococcus singaporensis]MBE5676881.1 accessory gene regulator B family protein [Staphylococcus singaporensis]